MTDQTPTPPLDLAALRWHLWEPMVVGTVETPRGTEYYVAMTSSPESATRIVEVHNALIARLENAEALYQVRHGHVLAAEEDRNQWRARAEAAEAAVARVRELAQTHMWGSNIPSWRVVEALDGTA